MTWKIRPLAEQYDLDVIGGRMSLRKPQREALARLDKILSCVKLDKPDETGVLPQCKEKLTVVHELYPICTDFERDFFSLAFALATGVGKTRLMGAFITYLYTHYGLKDYFVVAPNITIYDKLRQDLGNPDSEKYVFRGLGCFNVQPTIYTEDDYRQKRLQDSDVRIFVYNIDKFNTEDAKMRSVNEILGDSFVGWLGELDGLVLLMDESHHYRADKSAASLSLLRPVLGLELTATPFVSKGSKQVPFKNVVYEYPLSQAIADGYTRTPYALTRQNLGSFNFGEEHIDRLMLEDGLRWHEHIKEVLAGYAMVHNKRLVKPFVLVVCKDTAHAEEMLKYIQSEEFFGGKYRDKTIKVDSKQSKAQREANVKLLLTVEKADNPIEIVIHVNVLKEGWDVNNLYTIIPLRTASSRILREQLVGRGLRLPYGERTGVQEIDAVTLTAHDKFDEIVAEAQKGDSIFRAGNIIKAEEIGREKTVVTQQKLDFETNEDKNAKEDCHSLGIEASPENVAVIKKVKQVVKTKTVAATAAGADEKSEQEIARESVEELTRDEGFAGTYESNQEILERFLGEQTKKIKEKVMAKYIPIPRIGITEIEPPEYGFEDFSLDTADFNYQPADTKAYAQSLQDARDVFDLPGMTRFEPLQEPERLIVRLIRQKPQIDYRICSDLLWKLVGEAFTHYKNLHGEDGAKNIFLLYQKNITDAIYGQMMKHMTFTEGLYEERVMNERGSNYHQQYHYQEKVDLYSPYSADIRNVLFDGIEKGVFYEAKFDSLPELKLARILDKQGSSAQKWLRPAAQEFSLKYEYEGTYHEYQPDFVVETVDRRYLVEVKGMDKLNDPQVLAKKARGQAYCQIVTDWATAAGSKPWQYLFIPEDAVQGSTTFEFLAANYGK